MPDMKRIGAVPGVLASAILSVVGVGAVDGTKAQPPVGGSIFETQYSCRPKGPEGNLRQEDLTVFDFKIGVSSIREVQGRFPGTHPVRLTQEEEAEKGICIRNAEGMAAVFATGVMGAPDTLVAIYLAPARLIESFRVPCASVQLPSKTFSSKSGIRVGAAADEVARTVRDKLPTDGPFCTAYEIASSRGPMRLGKGAQGGNFKDFTGAEGRIRNGKVEWVKLFGIVSD